MLDCEYDVMDYVAKIENDLIEDYYNGRNVMEFENNFDFGYDFESFNKCASFSEMDEAQWDYFGEDNFGEDYDNYEFE